MILRQWIAGEHRRKLVVPVVHTKHALCRGCETLPYLLCCTALLSQAVRLPPPALPFGWLSSSEAHREDKMRWICSYCNSSISFVVDYCYWTFILLAVDNCHSSQQTPLWSITVSTVIHSLDLGAYVAFFSLVFLTFVLQAWAIAFSRKAIPRLLIQTTSGSLHVLNASKMLL